jgi:ABC-type lipoprotein release transport system permease subunit
LAVRIQLAIALAHLRQRPRATLVSLLGIILGVAFFLAVSSLMRGRWRRWARAIASCMRTAKP